MFTFSEESTIQPFDFEIENYELSDTFVSQYYLSNEGNFDFKNKKLRFGLFNSTKLLDEITDNDFKEPNYDKYKEIIDYNIEYYYGGVVIINYFNITEHFTGESFYSDEHWNEKLIFIFNYENGYQYVDIEQKENPLVDLYKKWKNKNSILFSMFSSLFIKSFETIHEIMEKYNTTLEKLELSNNQYDLFLKDFLNIKEELNKILLTELYAQSINSVQLKYIKKYLNALTNQILNVVNTTKTNEKEALILQIKRFFTARSLKINKNDLLIGYCPTKFFKSELKILVPNYAEIIRQRSLTSEFWTKRLETGLQKELTSIVFEDKPIKEVNAKYFI